MNLTSLEHVVWATGMLLVVTLLTGDVTAGAAAGAFFFLGREHAQAEYRWIEQFGSGRRANLPWWGAFDLRVWRHLDSWLDWIAPMAAMIFIVSTSK